MFKQTSKLSGKIILVLAGLIVLNLLAFKFFYRWDLTNNKIYSLSTASQIAVKNLSEPLTIEIYFSQDLPSQYLNLLRETEDIITEYAGYSGQVIIKPIGSDDLEKKAEEAGIPKLQFNDLSQDKLQVVNGYFGLALKYKDKSEAIPFVKSADNLEYQLTSLIVKMTNESRPAIGFVQGYGTIGLNEQLSLIRSETVKLYDVQIVNLDDKEEISQTIQTLVLPDPQSPLPESAWKKIDDFLTQGKSVLVLTDAVVVADNLQTHQSSSNVGQWLSKYGVQLGSDLVLDQSNSIAGFNQGFITFNVNYPFWPKIMKENIPQDNPIVSKLEGIVFPWTGLITIDESKIKEGDEISYLAKTSPKAWVKKGELNLLPNQSGYHGEETKQYNLAVELILQQSNEKSARLAVVSDADFIKDRFLNIQPQNMIFFQNLLDGLSLSPELAEIRSKEITDRPLKEISDSQKKLLRYGNIFGITVLVVLAGLARYYWRRKIGNFQL